MVEDFAIHAVAITSGGLIGIARLPGRSGDLAGDVATIAAWGADIVVSMTEGAEMHAKGGGGLPAALAARSIAWRHFPIVDYGAPHDDAARWPPLAAELHAVLARGGRVLAHCAGGCGRSGMVAMRLLVESGSTPEAALERLRTVRPCAVETAAQEAWAESGARHAPDRP
jgi:hypothetical protein